MLHLLLRHFPPQFCSTMQRAFRVGSGESLISARRHCVRPVGYNLVLLVSVRVPKIFEIANFKKKDLLTAYVLFYQIELLIKEIRVSLPCKC